MAKLTGIYKTMKERENEKLIHNTLILFSNGFTLRRISAAVGKSHEWVRQIIHKNNKGRNSKKPLKKKYDVI